MPRNVCASGTDWSWRERKGRERDVYAGGTTFSEREQVGAWRGKTTQMEAYGKIRTNWFDVEQTGNDRDREEIRFRRGLCEIPNITCRGGSSPTSHWKKEEKCARVVPSQLSKQRDGGVGVKKTRKLNNTVNAPDKFFEYARSLTDR